MMAAGWIFLTLRWDLEASLVARFPVAVVLHPKLPASHVRLIRLELSGQSDANATTQLGLDGR